MHMKSMRATLRRGGIGIAMSAIFLVAHAGLLVAEEGSFAQRRACKPDVFRFCSKFIPNRPAITACLQRNTSRLNPDCRAVFEGTLK